MAPPGTTFLLTESAKLLLLPTSIYFAARVLENRLNVSAPPILLWSAVGLSTPIYFLAKSIWSVLYKRWECASLGAVPTPIVASKGIGAYDVLQYMMERFMVGYIAEPFWPLMEKYGNIYNLRIFWIDNIITFEPEHVKQILSTEFSDFEKGDFFKDTTRQVLGTGVFNSDGDMWKFHRSMTRPFFTRDRVSDFDIFERHADEAIKVMTQRFREGYALDFQEVVSRFTLDSATEFLFGNCLDTLKTPLPYPHNPNLHSRDITTFSKGSAEEFARAFAEAQFVVGTRLRVGLAWPLSEIVTDKTKEPMTVVSAFLDPILEEVLRKKSSTDKNTQKDDIKEDETLLDHLARFTDDRTILKDEILNIMIAGRDTTACLLTYMTYLLALHPNVMTRLRSEILERVGPTNRPTYDDIREMKYLRSVINETLRLYPPVPFNIRTSNKATTLAPSTPGGKPYYVPKGTGVSYSVFVTHRRKDLWGPDADEFDPDRFLDERVQKYLTPNPFIFLPFNAGPRICLGQQFAYNESSFMIIRLLQAFDKVELDKFAQPADSLPPAYWKDMPGRQSVEQIFPKCHLTLYVHKGLWVKMHEADKSA